MRASVLVLGPLVARLGHARVSLPGGCAIGVRPIDQHLAGLEALGAEVELEHGYVTARAGAGCGAARFRFAMRTVGGTENLLMAAVLARGTTVLENCAREPEIVDLARLLTAMGARIDGAGGDRIEIEGVERLGGASHRVIPDRIEAGTYLLAAAMTGGDVEVAGAVAADLAPLLEKLAAAGCEVTAGRRRRAARPSRRARALRRQHRAASRLPDRPAGPVHGPDDPGARRVDAARDRLREPLPARPRAGADGRRHPARRRIARVTGPTPLSGARVMATDLRASASLVLAGLAAERRDGGRPHLPPRPRLRAHGTEIADSGRRGSKGRASRDERLHLLQDRGGRDRRRLSSTRTTTWSAFRDITPQAPTHVLIIPRRHIATLLDTTPESARLLGQMQRAAVEIARSEGLAERGFRLVTNCLEEAGQSVFHLHLHLLGGRRLGWPPG